MKNLILLTFIAFIHSTVYANEEPISMPLTSSLEISTQEIKAILSNSELPHVLLENEQIKQINKTDEGEFNQGIVQGRYVCYEILTANSGTKAVAVYFFWENYIGPVKPIIYFQPIIYPLVAISEFQSIQY